MNQDEILATLLRINKLGEEITKVAEAIKLNVIEINKNLDEIDKML
jgi:hypothetical protein